MEQLDNQRNTHTVRFIFTVVGLLLMAAGLGVVLFVALASRTGEDGVSNRSLIHVAWACLAMLGGVLILLVLTVMRYIRHRWLGRDLPPTANHPDAWEVAGQRMMPVSPNREASGEWRGDGEADEPDAGPDDEL